MKIMQHEKYETHRRQRKNELAGTIAMSVLSCIGAIFVGVLVFSALATLVDLPDEILNLLSGVALCAGCFSAAYMLSAKKRKHGLLIGLACGGIIFFVIFLIGLLFVGSFSAGGFFSKILMILACSCIGGVIGVNSPVRFR